MRKFKDITGERFGPLVAEYPKPVGQSKNAREWHCRCVHCDATGWISQAVLFGKLRKFCFHHGESGTPLYQAWALMNSRNKQKVDCLAWRQCYRSFKKWALDNGWKPGAVLLRFDTRFGFNPRNCLWALNGSALHSAPVTRNRNRFPNQ